MFRLSNPGLQCRRGWGGGAKWILAQFTETRPDTRPKPVADGWAGARMRVFTLCDRFQLERDGPTDRPTDQPTDGRTKPLIEMRGRI